MAIPPGAAIIAIGEVFGYVAPGTGRPAALGSVFARCHDAIDPGGLLMFDLAALADCKPVNSPADVLRSFGANVGKRTRTSAGPS